MKRWLFWVAWEWAILLSALVAASLEPWLIPLAVLVVGSRQHALGVLGHEVVHRTVPVPDWLCDILCMWPIGTSVAGYRAFHLPHHRWLGTERDPETHLKRRFAHRYNPDAALKWRLLTMDYLGLNAHEALILLRIVWGPTPVARVAHGLVVLVLFSLLSWWAPLVWIFALFSSFWMVHRMRTWREHYVDGDGVMRTYRLPCAWWQRALFAPHYIWKHHDHHAPGRGRVPCWELRG